MPVLGCQLTAGTSVWHNPAISCLELVQYRLRSKIPPRLRMEELHPVPGMEVSFLSNRAGKGCPKKNSLKVTKFGFPGSSVVKNPPANVGDTTLMPGRGRSQDFDPWSGKITTEWALFESLGTTTIEPTCHSYWSLHALEPILFNRSLQSEACTQQLESSLHFPQVEKSLHAAMKTQHSQKQTNK